MLSVANVRSAGGAASYFAKDNYYTSADADRSGFWVGKGAERLGLTGTVDARAFEAILRGELPNGSRIGHEGAAHRAGTDLTFSLPKSWSMLALIGKDQRIINAYREAVIETLQWAEKTAAFMRVEQAGKERQVQTDTLTVALFQHDTNRNQEPNLHFHAVVANMTQAKDGTWKALRNDRLWQLNTLLNAMTMARFRVEVERLGYAVGEVGKHGNFEAAGIDREAVMAFSTRRQEVLEARRGSGLEAGVIATLVTRTAKEQGVDRDALLTQWQERAWGLGLDLVGMVRDARERSTLMAIADRRASQDRPSIAQRGKVIRWTANDHKRGLINADRATITAIAQDGLAVRTSAGMDHKLEAGDPMLARVDLAYALNAHMAQGLTSDKGIAVMDSQTRKLLSVRNFLVTITRLRDELTLIVDNRDKVAMGIGRNPGDKTSALEVTERLSAAAAKGQSAGKAPAPEPKGKEPPELERTITKVLPFEMGI